MPVSVEGGNKLTEIMAHNLKEQRSAGYHPVIPAVDHTSIFCCKVPPRFTMNCPRTSNQERAKWRTECREKLASQSPAAQTAPTSECAHLPPAQSRSCSPQTPHAGPTIFLRHDDRAVAELAPVLVTQNVVCGIRAVISSGYGSMGASGGVAAALRIPAKPGQNPGIPRRVPNFQLTTGPFERGVGSAKARLSTTLATLVQFRQPISIWRETMPRLQVHQQPPRGGLVTRVGQEKFDVIEIHLAQTAKFLKFRVDFLLKPASIDKGFSFLAARSIEERLVGIENSLRTLVLETQHRAQNDSAYAPTAVSKSPKNMASQPLREDSPRSDTEENFEGDTSLLAHSLHAKGIFDKLSLRSLAAPSPRLNAALVSLQKTLKSENEPGAFYDMRFASYGQTPDDSEMPPTQAVLDLLRTAKEKISRMFVEWPIFSEDDFTEKCRNLYFCTTGYSPAHFIIVNSGLYFLFAEQSDTAPEHKAAELRRYSSMCRSNFERALEKLHLLITPSLEACQALLLGAFFAAEFAKPSLCLRLTSTAAQMCQDLGYHRLPAAEVETPQLHNKKILFWGIHALDKALSTRIGRTSIIQDCDISTTLPAYPLNPAFNSWHEISLSWIEFAKFQGRVFSELYTVSALSLPVATREGYARKLAAELHDWQKKECSSLSQSHHKASCIAVLTIIYRAIPPSSDDGSQIFYLECVASARKALELHQVAASRFRVSDKIWSGYIHWTLLYSPFAPFMVVFCEAIATFNFTDLHNLGEFVSSIQPNSGDSEAAVRLYNLCFAFYEVARVYLAESSASTPASGLDNTATVSHIPQSSQGLSEQSNNFSQSSRNAQQLPENFSLAPDTNFLGNLPDNDAFMTWPAENWFLPDQYMMGLFDGDRP
ncbi:hypothetical protein V502_03482 [Pseudogymnoascus sp. VKM F-4520 (FW-2644)]|nr:hypothetical protein V502_03482 [Pseudogymnoascus sp. VKM F-4520 (FW-2644)]